MKITTIVLTLLVIGCAPQQSSIQESEVTDALEGFFEALDVENEDPNLMDQYVTKDFMIYEAGKKMNKEEFLAFVAGFPVTKSDWELSDHRISIDNNSAHVSLYNTGLFELTTDSATFEQSFEWLESAYLVKVEDQLKIKFYFSANVSVTSGD